MDWTLIGNLNNLVNSVWGIINIGLTVWHFMSKKNQNKYLQQIEKKRELARKENQRACRNCKKSYESRIKSLEETKNKYEDRFLVH